MKVLIVDDNQLIVEDYLDEMGKIAPHAQCIGTSRPKEVMRLFEEYMFDVVKINNANSPTKKHTPKLPETDKSLETINEVSHVFLSIVTINNAVSQTIMQMMMFSANS